MASLLFMDNVSSGLTIILVLAGIYIAFTKWFSRRFVSEKTATKKAAKKGVRAGLGLGVSPGIAAGIKVLWILVGAVVVFEIIYR